MSSIHAFKALLGWVTGTVAQAGHPDKSHEAVLAVYRYCDVLGDCIPILKDYDEQENIITNISVAETLFNKFFHAGN